MISKNAYRLFYLVFLTILFFACGKKAPDSNKIVLAEVEGNYLYADDIENIIPTNASTADSIAIVEQYIRKWCTDVLMYENAKLNTPNEDEINMLVDEYRKTLIIHQYQQRLIEQRLKYEPSEQELKDFYDKFGTQLLTSESLVKGFIYIVPKQAKNLTDIRKWVRNGETADLEKLEQYSNQSTATFEYFGDDWMPISTILTKVPTLFSDEVSSLSSRKIFELTDSVQTCFLRIYSYLPKGAQEPYEEAISSMTNLLKMKAQSGFITNIETELYNDAVKSGKIKIETKQ